MWVLLLSALGIIASVLVFVIIGPQNFLFENDILGIGPVLAFSTFLLVGWILGTITGFIVQIAKAKNKNHTVGHAVKRGCIGLLVIIALLGSSVFLFSPVPMSNPVLMSFMIAKMPFEKAITEHRREQIKNKAVRDQHANPELTIGPYFSRAGWGTDYPIKDFARLDDAHIFVIGEATLKMGLQPMGPVLKLSAEGRIDRVFSKNLQNTLASLPFGANVWQLAYLPVVGNTSSFFAFEAIEADQNTGHVFFTKLDGSLLSVLPQKFPPPYRKKLSITTDGGVIVAKNNLIDPLKESLIEKYNRDGSLSAAFDYKPDMPKDIPGKVSADNLSVFEDGKIFFLYTFYPNDGVSSDINKMVILSPQGQTLWQKTMDESYDFDATDVAMTSDGLVAARTVRHPHIFETVFIDSSGSFLKKPGFLEGGIQNTEEGVYNNSSHAYFSVDEMFPSLKDRPRSLNSKAAFPDVEYLGRVKSYWLLKDGSKIIGGDFMIKQGDHTYLNLAHILPDGNLNTSFLQNP